MDKQKAADGMFDFLYKNRGELQDNRNGKGQYSLFAISVTLINEGYRKSDEVRKETVKEIIVKLTSDLAGIEYPPERQLIKGYIEMFKKQYDLEASK